MKEVLHQILDQIKRPLDLISESVVQAGYKLGSEIFFTLDVAASELYNEKENLYNLDSEKKKIDNISLISYYKSLYSEYPIFSIEDGLDENDWDGWITLNETLGDKIQLVGDDLTVTNIKNYKKQLIIKL